MISKRLSAMAKTLFLCAMTLCASTLLLNAQDIEVTQLKPDTAPKESAITFGSPDVAVPETPSVSSTVPVDPPVYGMKWVCTKAFPKKKFHVYDCNDEGVIYQNEANANNCFFVISKKEFRIYVYEKVNGSTNLIAHFPVCVAKNTGDKQKSGDGTTPVCAKDRKGDYIPFTISQIAQASTWRHDFKDGRGNILAYGDWFMRLKLNSHPRVASNTSIGIHGSSGNALSVPGRDSEGCIRLRNADLNKLRKFAHVGTKVIIKPENAGNLPYELEAQSKLGSRYQPAHEGYKLPDDAMWTH